MASSVTITDSWFRAVDDVTGGMAMTGFFMLVTNNSDKDVTIVGGSVADDVSAEPLEAHEVVEDATGAMVMQEVSGGITIPAGGSVELMQIGRAHV
jgi:copper(I)-binding protein